MSDAGQVSSGPHVMVAIPPAKDMDAEDVVWGLQTAEALWKRGERIDAIVWLRRAAQAAGEATDDDRALELARAAAELSDWMATLPIGQTNEPPPIFASAAAGVVAPAPAGPPPLPPLGPATYAPDGGPRSIDVDLDDAEGARGDLPAFPAPIGHPPSSPTMQTAAPTFAPHAPLGAALEDGDGELGEESQRESSTSVPPAERVHAGMFNPWDEAAPSASAGPMPPPAPRFEDEEEVITSIRPHQLAQQRADALAAAIAGQGLAAHSEPPPPRAPSAPVRAASESPARAEGAAKPAPVRPSRPRPPPLPPRARKPALPAPSGPALPIPSPPSARPARVTPPPPSPTQVMVQPEARQPDAHADANVQAAAEAEAREEAEARAEMDARAEAEAKAKAAAAASVIATPAKLGLDEVEAFTDLPDDARAAFAAAAEVNVLAEGEEVSGFALAYILSGTVDVAATMVDAPAARLAAGAVLRSRGTTDDGVPMRLIGVSSGVVATWSDTEVQTAFRTCPWVEEDLRTAADRLQTLVGVTIGPLGERLDASIREQIIGRLTMRTLSPGEVVVTAGQSVPGLLLVGVGEIELVDGDTVTGTVGSGEFVFPGEVLGAGAAPRTARAGAGGALILFGDRMIAQELLVTCPPLLEVFAGM